MSRQTKHLLAKSREIIGISHSDYRRLQFDRELNALLVWVGQADYYVSFSPNEVLVTVLGSCIAVCMRDPVVGCGGMNHFVLPEETTLSNELPGLQMRYGSYSIERLVNALASKGAKRERLEVKVFGGANVMNGTSNVGHRNADFVEKYFLREGFQIKAQHLRGSLARKVRYFPITGRVQLSELGRDAVAPVLQSEEQLLRTPNLGRTSGGVDIFD